MSVTDPKEIRDTILALMHRTFDMSRLDGSKLIFTEWLDATMRHAAGNIAQWVFLEYVQNNDE